MYRPLIFYKHLFDFVNYILPQYRPSVNTQEPANFVYLQSKIPLAALCRGDFALFISIGEKNAFYRRQPRFLSTSTAAVSTSTAVFISGAPVFGFFSPFEAAFAEI